MLMIGTTNTTIADLVHQLIIYQNATKMTIVDLVHRPLPPRRLRKSEEWLTSHCVTTGCSATSASMLCEHHGHARCELLGVLHI